MVKEEEIKLILQHAAVHEAGHAIMALHYDIPIKSIAIPSKDAIVRDGIQVFMGATSSDEGYVGVTKYLEAPATWNNYLILERVDVNYAGLIAERLIFNRHINGATTDIKKATKNILNYLAEGYDGILLSPNEYMGSKREETMIKLSDERRIRTTDILRGYKNLIRGLAVALLQFRTIEVEFYNLADLEQYLKSVGMHEAQSTSVEHFLD